MDDYMQEAAKKDLEDALLCERDLLIDVLTHLEIGLFDITVTDVLGRTMTAEQAFIRASIKVPASSTLWIAEGIVDWLFAHRSEAMHKLIAERIKADRESAEADRIDCMVSA